MTTDAVIYCDGACEPVNPGGVATFGWVAYWKGQERKRACGVVCEGDGATNNVAEYSALIEALQYLSNKGYQGAVTVRSDSQLIVNQLAGKWGVKSPSILPYYQHAKSLASKFQQVQYEWIPREQNTKADELSKQAYHDYQRGKKG